MAGLAAALTRAAPRSATLEQVCTAVIGDIVGDGPAEDDIALLLACVRSETPHRGL